jgi:hypothetical protein
MNSKTNLIVLLAYTMLLSTISLAQVKVGNNPDAIDATSLLELESASKVLVITRVTEAEMDALNPLPGAIVYNKDSECVFSYNGNSWKNLCDAANVTQSANQPQNNTTGDFWFNTSDNSVSVWNGSAWLPIQINPRRGEGVPNASINNPIAGDIYVNTLNGNLFTYNGTAWVAANTALTANNGVTLVNDTLILGGNLTAPTVITTNAANTLALQGLTTTTLNASKRLVVADANTGVLQKIESTNIVRQNQIVITATDGQLQFITPNTITSLDKIDVYRNGARIAFTQIDASTIEVEPEAICFQGDEIRIVQLD